MIYALYIEQNKTLRELTAALAGVGFRPSYVSNNARHTKAILTIQQTTNNIPVEEMEHAQVRTLQRKKPIRSP